MKDHEDFARRLLEKARGDLHVLDRIWEDQETPAWTIGFHAQQAIEKAIKAVLASRDLEFPRTHNLTLLVSMIRDIPLELPDDSESWPSLNAFGAAFRYDDELDGGSAPILDRAWAVTSAREAFDWASKQLSQMRPSRDTSDQEGE